MSASDKMMVNNNNNDDDDDLSWGLEWVFWVQWSIASAIAGAITGGVLI